MDDELEVDRSWMSVYASWTASVTYKRTGLDSVFTSLDSGQCVMSIGITMSIQLRPEGQRQSPLIHKYLPSDGIIIVDTSLLHPPNSQTDQKQDN